MNRTLLLVAALLLLVGVLALLAGGGRGGHREGPALLFPDATEKNAARIEITPRGGAPQVIEKTGETWSVSGHRAEVEAVNAVFDKLAKIDADQVVSKSREKQGLFEVDSTGLRVVVSGTGGKTLADFIVGKNGPDFQSNYVRPTESGNVYLSNEMLRAAFDRGRRGWRDRAILSFAAEEASTVRFAGEADTLALAKGDGGAWTVAGDSTRVGKAPVIDGVLRTLARFSTDEFADSAAADTVGLSPPLRTIEIGLSAGDHIVLEIGRQREPNQYWVRRAGQPQIYLVARPRVDNVFKQRDAVTEPRPAPASPAPADTAPAG